MRLPVASAFSVFAFASLFGADEVRAQAVEVEADGGVITMTGTVKAVDATRKIVTIVGPHNRWVEVKVGPEHLKIIKVREKVTIAYQDEVAVGLRKVRKGQQGDGFEANETSDMGLDAPVVAEQDWRTVMPGGATNLTTTEITDTVAAVNRNQGTITFHGTGGKTRTVLVGPKVDLDDIEPGDEVILEVTSAVAVSVKVL
jgi:hypothetical protein